ncbi:hypothetical protein [Parashewanella tropica]|uniref:hypothetical protein n=1 Tax=Parashewanella tropica TaxID=2547970 RepID=UPI0010592634|nr:hypothetical protein [Parashewanella tropica]
MAMAGAVASGVHAAATKIRDNEDALREQAKLKEDNETVSLGENGHKYKYQACDGSVKTQKTEPECCTLKDVIRCFCCCCCCIIECCDDL